MPYRTYRKRRWLARHPSPFGRRTVVLKAAAVLVVIAVVLLPLVLS